MEFLLEDDGVGLLICLEQSLDGDVHGASVLIGLHGEVEDGVVDGAVHPAADAGVGLGPQRVSRTGGRCAVDVTEQLVLATEGGEEGLPLGVVRSLEAEHDGDVLLDVDGSVRGVEQRRDGISHSTAGSRAENAGRSGGRGRRRQHDHRRLVLIKWSGGAGGARQPGRPNYRAAEVAACGYRVRRDEGRAAACSARRGPSGCLQCAAKEAARLTEAAARLGLRGSPGWQRCEWTRAAA